MFLTIVYKTFGLLVTVNKLLLYGK